MTKEAAGHPPRNVLTHPEETIRALAEIEGPEWWAAQASEGDDTNVRGMVRKVRAAIEKGANPDPAYNTGFGIVYGRDGVHRWLFRIDGEVILLGHYDPTPEAIAKAEALGFKVSKRPTDTWESNKTAPTSKNFSV